jgi:hypothetical protein
MSDPDVKPAMPGHCCFLARWLKWRQLERCGAYGKGTTGLSHERRDGLWRIIEILAISLHGSRRPIQRLREIFSRHAFEPNSQEICVLITINPTISGTLWNVTDRTGFNYADGGGERPNGQAKPI